MRRSAVLLCAFSAVMAFLLVHVVDPYSGATASPYFQLGERYNGIPTQTHVIANDINGSTDRDGYTVKAPPKVEAPAPAPATGSSPSKGSTSSETVAPPSPGSAKEIAYQKVMARWGSESQYQCLVNLWNRESGWNYKALNSSSGAYGIPQSLPGNKMASAGADWQTNPATQIEWGLGYIAGRYGTPCAAWNHSEANNWY